VPTTEGFVVAFRQSTLEQIGLEAESFGLVPAGALRLLCNVDGEEFPQLAIELVALIGRGWG
jgi:hypothetical protein